MSVMSVLGTISCLADRAVDAALVSSHWVFWRCVRSRALGDSMAWAFLQDWNWSRVFIPECCDSVLAAGNPDGKGGDEVGKWRLKRQVEKAVSLFSRHFCCHSSHSQPPQRMCEK
jgi:hypothetical protein